MLNETNEIRETRSGAIPLKDLRNRGFGPNFCLSRHPSSGEVVVLTLGQMGYRPLPDGFDMEGKTVEAMNAEMGIDNAIQQAMEAGSMFGYHVPGAFPEMYRKEKKS